MKNIFEALEAIKVKPELYIGSKNLTYLYHFINGYLFHITPEDDTSDKIRELHFWLPTKTGIDIENWLEKLLVKAQHNEEKALALFFYYIDIFKEEHNI